MHQVAPSVLRGISARPPPRQIVAPPNTAVQEPLLAVIVRQVINVTAPPLPLLQSVLLERTPEQRLLLVPTVIRDTSVRWTEWPPQRLVGMELTHPQQVPLHVHLVLQVGWNKFLGMWFSFQQRFTVGLSFLSSYSVVRKKKYLTVNNSMTVTF